MSKPRAGDNVELWDEREQKAIPVKIHKVTDTHVTVIMKDKKMWCMTLNDYTSKLGGRGW